jgi:hypothetical protein
VKTAAGVEVVQRVVATCCVEFANVPFEAVVFQDVLFQPLCPAEFEDIAVCFVRLGSHEFCSQ